MTDRVEYSYVSGDRLNNRNTYFYTPSVGSAMLQAWLDSRADVLQRLPSVALAPPPADPVAAEPDLNAKTIDTRSCMEWVWGRLFKNEIDKTTQAWLLKFLRKFEISKRFHRAYNARFLAVDKALYRDLALYVRGAEIMLRAYQVTHQLPYLNVSQKILDTLCSKEHELSPEEGARFAHLIRCEHTVILKLLGKE